MSLGMTDALPLSLTRRSLENEDGFITSSSPEVQSKDIKGPTAEISGAGSESDFSDESTHGGTFEKVSGSLDYYKPIATYEGAHRYDPSFQWTEKEEKKLVRKVGS